MIGVEISDFGKDFRVVLNLVLLFSDPRNLVLDCVEREDKEVGAYSTAEGESEVCFVVVDACKIRVSSDESSLVSSQDGFDSIDHSDGSEILHSHKSVLVECRQPDNFVLDNFVLAISFVDSDQVVNCSPI